MSSSLALGAACLLALSIGCGDDGGAPLEPCPDGFARCGDSAACSTPLGTATDCAACGDVCDGRPNSSGQCGADGCVLACAAGFGDCDGDLQNGCEAPLASGTSCEACDGALALDSASPDDAARALGICAGVARAAWVQADGSAPPAAQLASFHLGHGILPGFGANVTAREGSKLLALSSGTARQPTDPGYQSVAGFDKMYASPYPAGYPKEPSTCPGLTTGAPHDAAGIELELTVPPGAIGFRFDHRFFTYDWPGFICSTSNDQFVAMLMPSVPGAADANVLFDQAGDAMSVNSSLLEVCGCAGGPPCNAGGVSYTCALGTGDLAGTGFTDGTSPHGATGWLRTTAPVAAGTTQITLRLAIFDSTDGTLDSTALIDNFTWIAAGPVVTSTTASPAP